MPALALPSLISPPVFDFWASRVSRTWTWERPLARVVAKQRASANAVTLVLKPNRHWRGFVAGQHVNVSVEIDGRRMTRSYSPALRADGRIEITVKAIAGGKVSAHLCDAVLPGDVVEIGPAFGEMRLPETDAPIVMLAAGSGITPMLAMLRALALRTRDTDARAPRAPVTLLYWARTRDELCFVDELRAMAATCNVRFLLTRESALAGDEAEGRICAAQLAPWLSSDANVFACGPGDFVEQARVLTANHVATFFGEGFTPRATLSQETGTVTVTLAKSGRTLQLPRGQSLLTALEAEGLSPAHGCRMGICNTCACGKSSGATRHLQTGSTEAEPVSALRLCVNAPTSDLVLDL